MSTLMPARRLDPLQPFYDDFFRSFKDILPNDGWTSGMRSTMPAANITEQKEAFEVSLAVPGMKKEDFKVDIEGGMLTVSAEKERARKTATANSRGGNTATRPSPGASPFRRISTGMRSRQPIRMAS